MPAFTTLARNEALDALDPASISLHYAFSFFGESEFFGGAPPYVRQPVIFGSANLGVRTLNTGPYVFNVPALPVRFIGVNNSAGDLLALAPNGGGAVQPFTATAGNTITSPLHGFQLGSTLMVWPPGAGTLPYSLTTSLIYYVVGVTDDTLQIADAALGTPLTFTAGCGFLQGIIEVPHATQSTFTVYVVTLDANVVR